MFLSENEAERQLQDLRRERDRLDRLIADLALFLELGRRLPGRSGAAASLPGQAARPTVEPPPFDPSPSADARRDGLSQAEGADEPAWDRSLARREGRLLMEAAADILKAAGRPLHVGTIAEALAARGLSVPGSDPVAALNTRMWKRSGVDGPFLRLGDAVYSLAPDE